MQDDWITFARTGSPRTMLLGPTSAALDAPYEPDPRFWAAHAASAPRLTLSLVDRSGETGCGGLRGPLRTVIRCR